MEILKTGTELRPTGLIVEALTDELSKRSLSITIAEGCTGGSLLNNLTIPGATRVFHLGGIFYSQESKVNLGVPRKAIEEHGEYSLETAMAMAKAIRSISGDHLAIATVGDMDPPDDARQRSIFIGFAAPNSTWGARLWLKSEERSLIKDEIARIAFSQALFYLLQVEYTDKFTFPFLPLRKPSPQQKSLEQKASSLIDAFRDNNLRLATMESCTGGKIADAITNVPGSSEVFYSGWVAYDENAKAMLGVPLTTMQWGVYTEKVALHMAQAVLKGKAVDLAIATTGTMDTIDTRPYHNNTPPGTIYIAVCRRGRKPLACRLLLKTGTREDMKLAVADVAFDLAFESLKLDERKGLDSYNNSPIYFKTEFKQF